MNAKKKNRGGVVMVVAIIAIALITVALLGKIATGLEAPGEKAKKEKVEKEKGDESQEIVFAVNIVKAFSGEMVDFLDINGDISAAGSVDVYPDTAGKVVETMYGLGDFVRKNAVIAKIDSSRPGMNFAASPVKAPISGTITSINDTIGAMATQQMPIATIGVLSALQLTTYIPERFIAKVHSGMPAVFSLEAYPGVEFKASVTEISPVVDPSSRTMEVKLEIMEQDPRIKAGMFAKIRLTTEVKKDVIQIPYDCMISRFDEQFVYVVNSEGIAEKRTITTGLKITNMMEITSGVSAGESVVYQGQTLLSDGVEVNVKNEIDYKTVQEK